MRRRTFASLVAVPVAWGESPPELIEELRSSEARFLKAVNGLSAAQWNFKSAPERWSIAECAEHIAASEDFIRSIVEDKILVGAAPVASLDARRALDPQVLAKVRDRTFQAKAPEPLTPRRAFGDGPGAVSKFREGREKTVALARRSGLRDHAAPHPLFKELDAYQWLLFLSGHTERHTEQIEEVKAAAGYPK